MSLLNTNAMFHETAKLVVAADPVIPAGGSPVWVSKKLYHRLVILIQTATTTLATGSIVTLSQAKDVLGGSSKTLLFTEMWVNLDTSVTPETLVKTAVVGNTFTTGAGDNLSQFYLIEVDPEMMDIDGGWDCVAINLGAATNHTVSAIYILGPAKMAREIPHSAIVD